MIIVFFGCELEEIKIPNGIKIIPGSAFFGCRSLNRIQLPKQLEEIGGFAFAECHKLSAIALPEKLKRLGFLCFEETKISNIIIPSGGVEIRENIFGNRRRCIRIAFLGMEDIFKWSGDCSFNSCIFYCLPGSSASKYAGEHNIKVKHLSEFKKDIQEA